MGKDACWRVDGGNSLVIHAEPEAYEQRMRDFLRVALEGHSVRE